MSRPPKKDFQYKSGEILSDTLVRQVNLDDYNPDEMLRYKGRDLSLYDRMRIDDKICGIIATKKQIVLSCDWEIKCEDEDIGKEIKQALETIEPIPFLDVMHNLLDAWVYGFKLAEVIYGDVNGKWMPISIKPKYPHLTRFHTDGFGSLDYFYFETAPNKQFKLEGDGKFLLYTHPYIQDGNYYGTSDLQSVYREWWCKDLIVKYRNLYLQGYGMPTRMLTYDAAIPPALKSDVFELMDRWAENQDFRIPAKRNKATGLLEPFAEIKFLDVSRSGTSDYNATIEQLNTSIARTLRMPDKMGFTDSDGGSYALGQTQLEVFLADIRAIHARISDAFNLQILDPIVRNNWGDKAPKAKLHFVGLTEGLTEVKARIVSILYQSGYLSGMEEWLDDFLGVPPRDLEKLAEEQEEKKQMAADIANGNAANANKDAGEAKSDPSKENDSKKAAPASGGKEEPGGNATLKAGYASRFDYRAAKEVLDTTEGKAIDALNIVSIEIVNDLIAQVEASGCLETGKTNPLDTLVIRAPFQRKLNAIFQNLAGRLYFDGRKEGKKEIDKAELKVSYGIGKQMGWPEIEGEPFHEADWLKKWIKKQGQALTPEIRLAVETWNNYAYFNTGVVDTELLKRVRATVFDGLGSGQQSKVIAARIREQALDFTKARTTNIVRTNSARSYNQGKMDEFQELEDEGAIQGYEYVAILDDTTTPFCDQHDGQMISISNPMFGSINPPNHYQCRSTLVPIFVGEDFEDNWGEGVSDEAMYPQKGFGV